MTELHQISIKLSEGQKRKLSKAYRNREEVSLRLSKNALSGSDVLMVPMNTVKRLSKLKTANKGMVITISKYNIRRQTGSGIFSSILPVLRNVAPTIGKTLGLSALAGLASEGASQIVKKISGGQLFQVPNKNLYMLAKMADLLTKGQIGDLARAHRAGEDLLFKITQKQVGNGIGTLIASIGIPMIIDALKGRGGTKGRGSPRMGQSDGRGTKGRGSPRIGMPMAPPPLIGTWPNQSGGAGFMDMIEPLNQVGEWFVDTVKKKKKAGAGEHKWGREQNG